MAGVGLLGGGLLSYQEWQTDVACPDLITGVPACFVATGLFVVILLGTLHQRLLLLASAASVGGLLLSGPATGLDLLHGNVCPVTSTGVPMCYIAFSLFSLSLLGLLWLRFFTVTSHTK